MSVPLAAVEGAADAAIDAAADGAAADGAVVALDEQAARAIAAIAPNAATRDSDRSVRNVFLQRFRETVLGPLGWAVTWPRSGVAARADQHSPLSANPI
jgi:hypothetical protein